MFLVEFYWLNSLVINPPTSNLYILLHSTLIQTSRQIGQKSVIHIQHPTATMEDIIFHPNRLRNSSSPIHPPYPVYLLRTQAELLFISPCRQICRHESWEDFVNVALGDYRLAKCPTFSPRMTSQRTLRFTTKDWFWGRRSLGVGSFFVSFF